MIDHGRFQVALRRVIHDGKKRVLMQRMVLLPFAPSVGLELRVSAQCTFVVDEISYSLETGAFRATDRADRHGRRRAASGASESWRQAGFEVVDWAREQQAHSLLYLVREGPVE